VAVTLATLKAILAACEENNVIFMDGVMFMHHHRMNLLRKILHDPFAGDVKHVNSSFSFNSSSDFLSSNIRVKAALDPLGALGDLGW
jgi:predicted dehydrogenase